VGLLLGGNCVGADSPTNIFAGGSYGNTPLHKVGDSFGDGYVIPPPGLLIIGVISAGNNRLAGSDRYATSATIFDTENPCGNTVGPFVTNNQPVMLARGDVFADAISSEYAAGQLGTGILLTPHDAVTDSVIAAMHFEGVQTVFITGGSAAIGPTVDSQLQATDSFVCGGTGPRLDNNGRPVLMNTRRLAGPTRYDTNLAVNTFFTPGGVESNNFTTNAFNPAYKTAFLATGVNFPDAISAGAMANDEGYPVIITDGTALSTQAINEITDLGIQQLVVVGGPVAVSTGVVSAAGALPGMKMVIQIYGGDRTGTAACLAAFNLAYVNATINTALTPGAGLGAPCVDPGGATSPKGLVWGDLADEGVPFGATPDIWSIGAPLPGGTPAVGLARGDDFADALTSGPYLGGFNDAPLLLTEDPNTVGPTTTSFLQLIGNSFSRPTGVPQISGMVVFGGAAAVSVNTVTAAQNALNS
jgi:putative cell wall-binding protein